MQVVGGVIGAVIGFYVGGPVGAQVGWAAGSAIGGYISAPDTVGPRLQDRTVQISSYGAALPIVEGGVLIPGNVIWSTDIEEHKHSESSKGPKTVSFTYTASFAIAICDAGMTGTTETPPITGVRRIFADSKLVYDISPDAPVESRVVSTRFREHFVFYDGNEEQLPDPTMEAVKGVGEVPAYRGVAYVVFTNLPLGDYGNRIPSLRFETTTEPAAVNSAEHLAPMVLNGWGTDAGGRPFHTEGITEYTVGSYTGTNLGEAILELQSIYGEAMNKFVGYYTSENDKLSIFDPDIGLFDGNGPRYAFLAYNIDLPTDVVDTGMVSESGTFYCHNLDLYGAPGDGKVWTFSNTDHIGGTGHSIGHEGLLQYRIISGGYPSVPPGEIPAGYGFGNWCTTDAPAHVAFVSPNQFIRAERILSPPGPTCVPGDPCEMVSGIAELPGDPDYCISCDGELSPNITYEVTAGLYKQLQAYAAGDTVVTVPKGPVVFSSDPLATDSAFWTAAAAAAGVAGVYPTDFPVSVSLAGVGGSTSEAAEAGSALLADIVTRMSERVGLSPSQIDVTDLEGIEVLGYKCTRQMPARGAIEPLRRAFWFDAVERGRQVVFVKRGGALLPEIGADALGASMDSSDEPLVRPIRAMEEELPRVVNVAYDARSADYQVGVQSDRRTTVGSQQEMTAELSIVMPDDHAANVATGMLYEAWIGRTRRNFTTLRTYAHYEPTDRVPIHDGEFQYLVRIVDKLEDGPIIKWESVDDDVATYDPQSSGVPTPGGGSTIRFDGPMHAVLMDTPIFREADNNAGFYGAAAGYMPNWRGGQLYRSTDGGSTYVLLQEMTAAASIGRTQTALGDWAGGNVVDEVNSVDVKMHSGTLASITRAALLVGNGNAAVLGDEVILFQRAELIAPKTWRLTGLLRGRRGTERHIGTHTATDRFVLLDAANVYRIPLALDQVGIPAKYKAVSFGTELDDAPEIDFTNTATGLKPLSPVDARAARARGGDVTISWKRRTRFPISFTGPAGVVVPLGEASEAYVVEVYADDTFATVLRVLAATAPTAAYTAAQQLTDFGEAPSELPVRIYQVSASVGRGQPLEAVLPLAAWAALTSPIDTFVAATSNQRPIVQIAAGDNWLVSRQGTSAAGQAIGLFVYDGAGTEMDLLQVTASSNVLTPYLAGMQITASDPATGRFVLLLRAQGNPSGYRKLLYGTLPTSATLVTPAFMPANEPMGLWWTGSEFRALLADGAVWSSPTGAVWTSEGASTGAPTRMAAVEGAFVEVVAGALAMKFTDGAYFCADTDGLVWTAAIGDLATLPTATYDNGFALVGIASTGTLAVISAMGRISGDYRTYGLLYTTTDGEDWTLEFEEEVVTSYISHDGRLNAGLQAWNGDFLTDLWPVVGGSNTDSILPVVTFGTGEEVTYAYYEANGKAADAGIVAVGRYAPGIGMSATDQVFFTSDLSDSTLLT